MKHVATFPDLTEAHLLAHRLGEEGIRAEILGGDLLGAAGGVPMVPMVRVLVADEHAARGAAVLKEIEREAGHAPVIRRRRHPVMAAAILILMAAPVATLIVKNGLKTWRHYAQDTGMMTPLSASVAADAPLLVAAEGGDMDGVRRLVAGGDDVNRANGMGVTALMTAAHRGDVAMCDFLLGNGAKVNAKDRRGHSALIVAGYNGKIDTVATLLKAGADIEQRDGEGLTPLMYLAATGGNRALIGLLLDHGASADAVDPHGRTAEIVARQSKDGDMGTILLLEQAKTRAPRKE